MAYEFELCGVWTPYKPDPWPVGWPEEAAFLQNEQGEDFYAWQRKRLAEDDKDVLYFTALKASWASSSRPCSATSPTSSRSTRCWCACPGRPDGHEALEAVRAAVFQPRHLRVPGSASAARDARLAGPGDDRPLQARAPRPGRGHRGEPPYPPVRLFYQRATFWEIDNPYVRRSASSWTSTSSRCSSSSTRRRSSDRQDKSPLTHQRGPIMAAPKFTPERFAESTTTPPVSRTSPQSRLNSGSSTRRSATTRRCIGAGAGKGRRSRSSRAARARPGRRRHLPDDRDAAPGLRGADRGPHQARHRAQRPLRPAPRGQGDHRRLREVPRALTASWPAGSPSQQHRHEPGCRLRRRAPDRPITRTCSPSASATGSTTSSSDAWSGSGART